VGRAVEKRGGWTYLGVELGEKGAPDGLLEAIWDERRTKERILMLCEMVSVLNG